MNFREFQQGVYDLFTFKDMSFANGAILWVIVYLTIAAHELGHGLTCKRYGGEVHEIGFLFLFFQPCMYANVNDAWLFDKKWKQIMVTIAGGYIEFWIGSIFSIIWALTSPNTFIHLISFQVMAIASISTIAFNFNPLMKLDGYYLLADFLEIPNLKENGFKYLKYLSGKHIFKMPQEADVEEDFLQASKRERTCLFLYGSCSFFYMFGVMTGLVMMAHGLLVDSLNATGVVLTGWVAYKFLGSYVTSSAKFMLTWYMKYQALFKEPKIKKLVTAAGIGFVIFLLFPFHYTIRGNVTLEPGQVRIIRAKTDGKIIQFVKKDGEYVRPGDVLLKMENPTVVYDHKIASLEVDKLKSKLRKTILEDRYKVKNVQQELESKKLELNKKDSLREGLNLTYDGEKDSLAILSCQDQINLTNAFVKTGDEICRVIGIDTLRAVVQVSEQQVKFLSENQEVEFKVPATPFITYEGVVHKIRQLSTADPRNPGNKMYSAEIIIKNTKKLKPGMEGIAKILAGRMMMIKIILIKMAFALRMDLFF